MFSLQSSEILYLACTLMSGNKTLSPRDAIGDVMQIQKTISGSPDIANKDRVALLHAACLLLSAHSDLSPQDAVDDALQVWRAIA